ncbi:MAG: hypothetical protein CVU94_02655 [Firmicutes bacterium HGW-Firmicutes-19]|jgi:hypothetical protein|nr:MAG: hypothetical protein CVU94_02655 [Firmicutes bacterium HGW-Firmicutes-19]
MKKHILVLTFITLLSLSGCAIIQPNPTTSKLVVYELENDRTLKMRFEKGSDDRIETIMFRIVFNSVDLREEGDTDDEAAYDRFVESYESDVAYFTDLPDVFVSNRTPDIANLQGVDGFAISVYVSDDFKPTAQQSGWDVSYALTIIVDFTDDMDDQSIARVLSYVGLDDSVWSGKQLSFDKISRSQSFLFFDVIKDGVRAEFTD